MNNSPRFRVGDRIQSGGAPDLVYQVTPGVRIVVASPDEVKTDRGRAREIV